MYLGISHESWDENLIEKQVVPKAHWKGVIQLHICIVVFCYTTSGPTTPPQLQSTSVLITPPQLQSTSVPITPPQLQSTSVPGDRENDFTCSESCSSVVIAVSAVSLLLIVTLTTVILTQCLLMIRMRKSKDVLHKNETYAEVMTPTTMHMDVPVTPNEAYALHKITSSTKEVTYELVK